MGNSPQRSAGLATRRATESQQGRKHLTVEARKAAARGAQRAYEGRMSPEQRQARLAHKAAMERLRFAQRDAEARLQVVEALHRETQREVASSATLAEAAQRFGPRLEALERERDHLTARIAELAAEREARRSTNPGGRPATKQKGPAANG